MSVPVKFVHGVVSGINTTAKQIYSGADKPDKGIEVKASTSNSGVLYIGNSDVGVASGFPLSVIGGVGESVFIPIRQPNELYVIGDANSLDDELRFYFV